MLFTDWTSRFGASLARQLDLGPRFVIGHEVGGVEGPVNGVTAGTEKGCFRKKGFLKILTFEVGFFRFLPVIATLGSQFSLCMRYLQMR